MTVFHCHLMLLILLCQKCQNKHLLFTQRRRRRRRRRQQQQQPFYGPLSGTTRVGRYQKKHSPTHHPDHQPIFISFFHLPRSITSSLFKCLLFITVKIRWRLSAVNCCTYCWHILPFTVVTELFSCRLNNCPNINKMYTAFNSGLLSSAAIEQLFLLVGHVVGLSSKLSKILVFLGMVKF